MCKLKVNNYYHGLFFHKSENLKCFSTIMANKTTSFFMISLMKEPIISAFSLAAETDASKGFLLEFH